MSMKLAVLYSSSSCSFLMAAIPYPKFKMSSCSFFFFLSRFCCFLYFSMTALWYWILALICSSVGASLGNSSMGLMLVLSSSASDTSNRIFLSVSLLLFPLVVSRFPFLFCSGRAVLDLFSLVLRVVSPTLMLDLCSTCLDSFLAYRILSIFVSYYNFE